MELVWVGWFVFGLIVGVCIGLAERKSDTDNNRHISDPGVDREYSSMDRPSTGEMLNVLYGLKLGACKYEREVMDYIAEELKKGACNE